MRKSRFTESQIVEILKQGEAGVPIAEILRQHNISKATYFQWRAKYAGASVAELKRLKEPWTDGTDRLTGAVASALEGPGAGRCPRLARLRHGDRSAIRAATAAAAC